MKKLELTYESIAEEIQCGYFGEGDSAEIKDRLNHLIGAIVEASNYLPDDWGCSTKWAETEEALLHTQNLLTKILFKL
jgi:hypothetical protein|tara:strand:+ start:1659 stop:1892 length:234 start_codon:yes stop_codon:yes gene_type:complete